MPKTPIIFYSMWQTYLLLNFPFVYLIMQIRNVENRKIKRERFVPLLTKQTNFHGDAHWMAPIKDKLWSFGKKDNDRKEWIISLQMLDWCAIGLARCNKIHFKQNSVLLRLSFQRNSKKIMMPTGLGASGVDSTLKSNFMVLDCCSQVPMTNQKKAQIYHPEF